MRVALSLLVLCLVACGPSNAEIKTAKAATYPAAPNTILDVAVQVTQRTYPVTDVDIEHHMFRTATQFYSVEGDRESPGADGFVTARGGSVSLTLIVQIVTTDVPGNQVAVSVVPKTFQVVAGSPKPRELRPDDPNLPPWVLGRVDALALEIYKEAKKIH
jgi:hypothetical protein